MQIPAKIQHGEKVIATVFDKINGIIDYLNASRIRKGPGILVDETPSGTVIKLADNRPATPPQVLPAQPPINISNAETQEEAFVRLS